MQDRFCRESFRFGNVPGGAAIQGRGRNPEIVGGIARQRNRKLALPAGAFDIYDIGGRLLGSFKLETAQAIDVRSMQGASSSNIIVLKKRVP